MRWQGFERPQSLRKGGCGSYNPRYEYSIYYSEIPSVTHYLAGLTSPDLSFDDIFFQKSQPRKREQPSNLIEEAVWQQQLTETRT
jgi:hypothetical protein